MTSDFNFNESVERLADVLEANLRSPNCVDRNLEVANVVDGLYEIARAIYALTQAIKEKAI